MLERRAPLHQGMALHVSDVSTAGLRVLVVLARRVRSEHRPASIAVHSAFGVQILLGIATVWSGVALWLAVLHQLTGALLVAATAWGVHALGRQRG